jgi:hypothetical protein
LIHQRRKDASPEGIKRRLIRKVIKINRFKAKQNKWGETRGESEINRGILMN